MNIESFKKIVKQIKNTFLANKKVIEDCIKTELKNGYIVSLNSFIDEIDITEKELLNTNLKSNKKSIAIIYDGKPETALNMILNSIYFENDISLYPEGYELISMVIIQLIIKTLEEFKIKDRINLFQELDVQLLEKNDYDNIIYIGDYFEYEKIQSFVKKEIEYNSFGFLKVYINKDKYLNEYKDLMKNSYKSNISVEYYEDIEEFSENVNSNDTVIIYEDGENLDIILKNINPKKILKHEEYMKSYRFSYI